MDEKGEFRPPELTPSEIGLIQREYSSLQGSVRNCSIIKQISALKISFKINGLARPYKVTCKVTG